METSRHLQTILRAQSDRDRISHPDALRDRRPHAKASAATERSTRPACSEQASAIGSESMTEDDFPLDGMPALDPTPDEDAWEAYLTFALERLGADGSNGVTNAQLAELEAACGVALPFEIGLLLVMGVPDGERWRRWGDDPAGELAEWNAGLLDGILFDVVENDIWYPAWGDKPDPDHRGAAITEQFSAAPQLLPLYGHRAVPLAIATDETAMEANPILSIMQTDVIVYGKDLADWLHREFEVPLPMWPPTAKRTFPFWSDLS